ncbi:MAG: serine/threonine protein kinase [Pirellulaceae bacterium]
MKASLAGKHDICPHCQMRLNIPFEQSAIDTSVAVKVDDDTSGRNENATEGVQQRIDNLFKLLRDTSQPETPQFPSQIGKYRLQEVIGEGGFGVVYLAQDQELSRPVALKLAKAFSAGNQQFEEVAKEAKTLAKLEHPNIAQIYDVGIEAGVAYIASQYVNGIPLSEWLREQPRSETEIINVFKLICDAVEHAHQRGVVHRDLKPTNILIDAQANPSILDFGLAKITDTEMSFSDDGRILGHRHTCLRNRPVGKPPPSINPQTYLLWVLCSVKQLPV